MLNPFSYADYRKLLRDAVEAGKKRGRPLSLALLAERARVQRSFLSHVLAGRAQLSADQFYAIGKELGFTETERDYALLLLEIDRCALAERREALELWRKRIQAKALRTDPYLASEKVSVSTEQLSLYYCDPAIPLTHMALTIPKLARDHAALMRRLALSSRKFKEVLATLEKCGVI